MKTNFTKTASFLVAAILCCTSCASSYHAVHPQSINYGAKVESNDIVLQYKYDVLAEAGNKKYAKKEKQHFVQVVAVKITNNSDHVIDATNDLKFFAGQNQFAPIAPELAQRQLKQGVPIYLLYLLFTPMQLTTTTGGLNGVSPETNTFPLGVILGPGLTLFNVVRASSANKLLLRDLQSYNIANRQLMPGETLYGLVTISNSGYNPITIQAGEEVAETGE
ncbi:hypothetical protein [Pontibacter chitinilyticus]|uniref:hypothetical protein n=1 Tax=Pontibacter chitinilyticus TaxID=2674989 RepID=UPI003219ABC4